jgi:hypothetical protein
MRGHNATGIEGIPPEQVRGGDARPFRPVATRRRRLRRAANQTGRRQLHERAGGQSPLSVRLEANRHERGALNRRMERDFRMLGLAAGDVTDLGPLIAEADERVERASDQREEADRNLDKVSEGRKRAAIQQVNARHRYRGRAEDLVDAVPASGNGHAAPVVSALVPVDGGSLGAQAIGGTHVQRHAPLLTEEAAFGPPVREENVVGGLDGLSADDREAITRSFASQLGAWRRRPLLNPVFERVLLFGSALGEFGLNYVAAQVMALPAKASIAFTVSVSIATIMLAVTVGRLLNRLPEGPDGIERFTLRRAADATVILLAIASGVGIAIAIAFLREAYLDAIYASGATAGASSQDVPPINQDFLPWLRWLALGLLGLAVSVAYAGAGAPPEERHPLRNLGSWLVDRLRRWWILRAARQAAKEELAIANEELKRADTRLQEARDLVQAAEVELRKASHHRKRLREELERRGSKLLGIEQAVVRGWRQQAAIGDAACHQLDRYLAQAFVHHRKGLRDRLWSWWRGRPWDHEESLGRLEGVATDAGTWEQQVDRVTRRAKELHATSGAIGSPSVAGPAPAQGDHA